MCDAQSSLQSPNLASRDFPLPLIANLKADDGDRQLLADWRQPAGCYLLCQSAFEHDEQRAQSLPRATARPRSARRPRCLRRLARTCCSGGHLDAVWRLRPMGICRIVLRVSHRLHARFHPSRRLVLARSASSWTPGDSIAAVGDWLLLAGSGCRRHRPRTAKPTMPKTARTALTASWMQGLTRLTRRTDCDADWSERVHSNALQRGAV